MIDVVEAIYEDGVLKVLNPARIDSDLMTVKVMSTEEILSNEEEELLKEALSEREKGRYHPIDEMFG